MPGIRADKITIQVRKEDMKRLLLQGYTLREIATQFGLSYPTIRHYCDPTFMASLKELSATVFGRVDEELTKGRMKLGDRMLEASDKALDKLIELMDDASNDKVKLEAANSILDRTAEGARNKKTQEEVSHKFVDPLFLVHAANTAREMEAGPLPAPADGKVIDG